MKLHRTFRSNLFMFMSEYSG